MTILAHLFRKHEPLYRAHLTAQIQAMARDSAGLVQRNLDLARDIGVWRSPALAARSAELATIRARVEDTEPSAEQQRQPEETRSLEDRLSRQSRELERTRRELELIRASMSWRITAPIRQVYRFQRWLTSVLPFLGMAGRRFRK